MYSNIVARRLLAFPKTRTRRPGLSLYLCLLSPRSTGGADGHYPTAPDDHEGRLRHLGGRPRREYLRAAPSGMGWWYTLVSGPGVSLEPIHHRRGLPCSSPPQCSFSNEKYRTHEPLEYRPSGPTSMQLLLLFPCLPIPPPNRDDSSTNPSGRATPTTWAQVSRALPTSTASWSIRARRTDAW